MDSFIKILVNFLRNLADKLEGGNSNLTQEELTQALEIMSAADRVGLMSRTEAEKYLRLSRTTFTNYIALDLIPRGRKKLGFKEHVWSKLELDAAKLKINKYIGKDVYKL